MSYLYDNLKPFIPLSLVALFGVTVYYFTDIYFCVLSGVLIAYLLHLVTQYIYTVLSYIFPMQSFRSVVWFLSILIAIGFYFLIGLLGFSLLAPTLSIQFKYIVNLITNESTYTKLNEYIQMMLGHPLVADLKGLIGPQYSSMTQSLLMRAGMFIKDLLTKAGNLTHSIIYSAHSLISAALAFGIGFHIIREWDEWPRRLERLESLPAFNQYADRIDLFATFFSQKVQSWIRGQLLIATLMCLYYSIAFTILQIPTSGLLGILFGCAGFVPYLGDVVCFISMAATLISMNAGAVTILLTVILTFVGHAIAGYIVGPLLIGKTTDVNPVQVMTGFLINAKLFGVPGIILNIPLCIIVNGLIQVILYKPATNDKEE